MDPYQFVFTLYSVAFIVTLIVIPMFVIIMVLAAIKKTSRVLYRPRPRK